MPRFKRKKKLLSEDEPAPVPRRSSMEGLSSLPQHDVSHAYTVKTASHPAHSMEDTHDYALEATTVSSVLNSANMVLL